VPGVARREYVVLSPGPGPGWGGQGGLAPECTGNELESGNGVPEDRARVNVSPSGLESTFLSLETPSTHVDGIAIGFDAAVAELQEIALERTSKAPSLRRKR
jgi:hypothetical protein